jgi:hypothetical protein
LAKQFKRRLLASPAVISHTGGLRAVFNYGLAVEWGEAGQLIRAYSVNVGLLDLAAAVMIDCERQRAWALDPPPEIQNPVVTRDAELRRLLAHLLARQLGIQPDERARRPVSKRMADIVRIVAAPGASFEKLRVDFEHILEEEADYCASLKPASTAVH